MFQKTNPPNFSSNFVKSEPIVKKIFTDRLSRKFAMQYFVDIPPYLTYVATLPSETWMTVGFLEHNVEVWWQWRLFEHRMVPTNEPTGRVSRVNNLKFLVLGSFSPQKF